MPQHFCHKTMHCQKNKAKTKQSNKKKQQQQQQQQQQQTTYKTSALRHPTCESQEVL
jgi:hypothetical protein